MGHVEQAAVGAAVQGGVDDGILVLDRHRPAGERDHLPAVGYVEVVEDGLLQVGGGCGEMAAAVAGEAG